MRGARTDSRSARVLPLADELIAATRSNLSRHASSAGLSPQHAESATSRGCTPRGDPLIARSPGQTISAFVEHLAGTGGSYQGSVLALAGHTPYASPRSRSRLVTRTCALAREPLQPPSPSSRGRTNGLDRELVAALYESGDSFAIGTEAVFLPDAVARLPRRSLLASPRPGRSRRWARELTGFESEAVLRCSAFWTTGVSRADRGTTPGPSRCPRASSRARR